MKEKVRVAVLDANGALIGAKDKAKMGKADLPCGDLPVDGSYFWNGNTFVPVGFGLGKPDRPPVPKDKAVYLMMKAMIDGTPIPKECADWCAWFERYGSK